MKTILEILQSIPSKYHEKIEDYPNLNSLYRAIKNGNIGNINMHYEFHMDRRDLFFTAHEIKKARNKRINCRNKERYGKWFIKNRQKIKNTLYNGKCPGCLVNKEKSALTIDHIVPISEGGTNEISNMQLLCKQCHFLKDGPEGSKKGASGGVDPEQNKQQLYIKKYK